MLCVGRVEGEKNSSESLYMDILLSGQYLLNQSQEFAVLVSQVPEGSIFPLPGLG